MQKRLSIIGLVAAALSFSIPANAIMVMSFDVKDLTTRAEKIFVGTCTDVSHKVNGQGIPVLEVTFMVSETVKGNVGTTITFQQLDTQAKRPSFSKSQDRIQENPQRVGSAIALANLPSYTIGEEALLFLAAPGKTGLTAPIGFTQGKLPISTLASGKKMITNTAFRKTDSSDSALPAPGKTAQYEQFLTAVRKLAQQGQ